MAITVDAIYENGVLRPVHPLALAEQERVRVTVEAGNGSPVVQEGSERGMPARSSLAERIVSRAHSISSGGLDRLPDDLAAEHDHYLYGSPKQSE